MPGIGQMYNGQFVKGLVFLIMEHFDNIFGGINQALYLDFNGLHTQALQAFNFQYALLYPGFYTYVVWDAFFHAEPNGNPHSIFVFIVAGFIGTITALFASNLLAPALFIGFSMLIPMLIGVVVYRK
jgi:hypothetical protein